LWRISVYDVKKLQTTNENKIFDATEREGSKSGDQTTSRTSTCFARLPKTNSIASITLLFPLPLGPTTAEKHCGIKIDMDRQKSRNQGFLPHGS